MAASRYAWLVAAVSLGCGRSELWIPPERRPEPPERRSCVEPSQPSAVGCAFVVAPGLHLSQPLTELLEVDPALRDLDGVLVVNPELDRSLQVDAYHALGDGEMERLGETITLAAGEHRLLELPASEDRETSGMRDRGIVWLTGDLPFTASLHLPYRSFLGNDSGLLLPEARWGRRTVVAAYAPHAAHFQGVGEPTYFEIVAREDDTRVRWLARHAATAGDGDRVPEVPAGVWSPELTLDAYEAVLIVAADGAAGPHDRDVTGTIVEASAPVQVTAGSRCSAVPASTDAYEGCDPLFEPLPPVEQWGRTHVVPCSPRRTREAHHYRVLAGEDAVALRSDPSVLPLEPTVLAAAGDFVDVVVPHGTSFVLESTGPALVMAYLETRDDDETIQLGDPAMYVVPPVEQFLARHVATTGVEWDTHFLQLVRPRGGGAWVDGQAVTGWEPLGAYETAQVEVTEGSHVVEGTLPVGLLLMGWTNSVHPACVPYSTHGTCQTSYAQLGGIGTRMLR